MRNKEVFTVILSAGLLVFALSIGCSQNQKVVVSGSGESSESTMAMDEGRMWVMANVFIGTRWNPAEWMRRFGRSSSIQIDRGNPRIIKGWYFPSIDVTVFVNVLKGGVANWTWGKTRH